MSAIWRYDETQRERFPRGHLRPEFASVPGIGTLEGDTVRIRISKWWYYRRRLFVSGNTLE